MSYANPDRRCSMLRSKIQLQLRLLVLPAVVFTLLAVVLADGCSDRSRSTAGASSDGSHATLANVRHGAFRVGMVRSQSAQPIVRVSGGGSAADQCELGDAAVPSWSEAL